MPSQQKKAHSIKSTLIGSRQFYRHVLGVAVPIMIQNGISNFVSLLDNIMVGQVGTAQMSGVSISNQLVFVYNLMVFGGLAGIGIFTAQFFGKKDEEGIRYTIRIKIILAIILSVGAMLLLYIFGESLIGLWLQGSAGSDDAQKTLSAARSYLNVMLIGFVPFAAAQVLSGTLRESGETMVPMKAGVVAVLVNLAGNAVFIFGLFGVPAFGATGAAIATVISRFVELGYVIVWMVRHKERVPYMKGLFAGFHVPRSLAGNVILKAMPLLFNETLWSLGQTVLSQQYSLRGLDVVAAFNIANTINNVFGIVFIAMGDAVAIILGQELGRGKTSEVKTDAYRLAFFTVCLCLVSGFLLFFVSPVFPKIYNTTDEIRELAAGLIRVYAVCMPMYGYQNCAYFTLRSGGKTWISFVFDSCFVWGVSIPLAYLLLHFTSLTILPLYFIVQAIEIVKVCIGFFLVRKGSWIHNLTVYTKE